MKDIGCKRSLAKACLRFAWGAGLMSYLSWVDNFLCSGKATDVKHYKDDLMSKLDCEDVVELKEHVGCKIEQKGGRMKLTQPVLVQNLEN